MITRERIFYGFVYNSKYDNLNLPSKLYAHSLQSIRPTHKYKYYKIHLHTLEQHFLVPRIKIVDERHQEVEDRIFYDKGSTIKLKCMVENIVGEQPEYIIWKKGDRMLNYDTERGGIRCVGL